ncbi:MAG TPA: phenylalanine--tRNA ligase subunit alpha [Patescibacteria group bacterium]|nr:phenylalanine--tRNA ligase subunit alpha [Patescibacteria group bacterium]
MLEQKILSTKEEALGEIRNTRTKDALFAVRKKYVGRKSPFNQILKGLRDLSVDEKKKIGALANTVKNEILSALDDAENSMTRSFDVGKEKIDITMPGRKIARGHLHPITLVQNEVEDIFTSMGFAIADGPEVETEWYNFDAVNMPDDHPGRDMQDTFWISRDPKRKKGGGIVLRTHTTSVQVRYMEKHAPPFRIIIPGRVFRHEATDASHEHTFHQFEGLMVGENVTMGNFLHVSQQFFSAFFKKKINVRLRPGYFPFVEPGFEFDISCVMCDGKGCGVCKHTGWVEIAGAGMVHQNVFVAAGYPRGRYTGFAFGFGLTRLAMMRYKIDDIRLFYGGDLRFINQF